MSFFDGLWGKSKSSSKKNVNQLPPELSASSQAEDGAAKFTLPYLKTVHAQLIAHKADPGSNEVIVVECLRVIAEMVVYGDKKCEMLFDFFCEKNMLALFLEIMRAPPGCPTTVNIQILQTLSILCQCVRNNTSIYYLLSNNYINEIIDFPYDFEDEEGVCDNFISFMKSLSLRLNSQTVQFFFVEEDDTFPLLSRAISFLHFSDPMVRTAAQATILNVLRIPEDRAREFALRDDVLQAFASEVVQAFESQHSTILALCLEYCAYTSHPNTRELTKGKVGNRIEDQLRNFFNGLEDWLYYLQDLFSLHISKLTYVLTSQLISQYIYPVILDPFTRNQQWKFSEMFKLRKEESKTLESQNGIPKALNMDYFSKKPDILLDRTEVVEPGGDGDAPSELSREDSSVSLIVSMFLMNQILDIIREKRIRRSIMVAVLHPFSQQQRKILLNDSRRKLMNVNDDDEEEEGVKDKYQMDEDDGASLVQLGFNAYRGAFGHVISSERDRFTLLSCLLIEKFLNLDVAECHERSKTTPDKEADLIEFGQNVLLPLSLLRLCSPREPQPPLAEEDKSDEQPESIATVETTDELNDHEAWLASVKNSVNDISIALENEDKSSGDEDDEKVEDKAWTGAGPNGRQRGCSADMNDGCNDSQGGEIPVGLENVVFDADGISVKGLEILADKFNYVHGNYDALKSERPNMSPSTCGLDNRVILEHVLALFRFSTQQSLAVLQAATVVVYDVACLSHYAHKPLHGSDLSSWRCPSDILLSKAAVLSALQSTAKSLLERANGWLSDTLLSQLEEEIRRSLGGEKKWVNALHKIARNLLLVLPPTTYISKRLGLDHSIPTSQVESSRRELQIFLLMRSLYLCLSRLSSSPFAMSTPQDLSDSLVDEFISIFSEHGGSTPPYLTGTPTSLQSSEELSYSACVVFPRLDSNSDNGVTSKGHITPPPKKSQQIPTSSSTITDSLYANGVKMKNKLSPIPKLVGSTIFGTGDRPHQMGGVVFVKDDTTLLLVMPDNGEEDEATSGTVLLAVPLHRTDAVSDEENSCNVKLLVRSPVPIASMACLSSPDANDSGGYDPLKMARILPPRCPGALYQMVIAFESKEVCDEVIHFIETRRLHLQKGRISSLREMLSAWVETTS